MLDFFAPKFEPTPNGVEAEENGQHAPLARGVQVVYMQNGRPVWGARPLVELERYTEEDYRVLLDQFLHAKPEDFIVLPSTPFPPGKLWEIWNRAQAQKALERVKKEADCGECAG